MGTTAISAEDSASSYTSWLKKDVSGTNSL